MPELSNPHDRFFKEILSRQEAARDFLLNWAALLLLKYVFREELSERLTGILTLLRELGTKRSGLEYIETLLRYMATGATTISEHDLRKAVSEAFPEQGGELMSTIAEKWIEQGIQQGIEQGIQQGIQQGAREGLLKAIQLGLELKFGAEGITLYPEIKKIEDMDVLDTISEAIKSVKTLEEVERIYKDLP